MPSNNCAIATGVRVQRFCHSLVLELGQVIYLGLGSQLSQVGIIRGHPAQGCGAGCMRKLRTVPDTWRCCLRTTVLTTMMLSLHQCLHGLRVVGCLPEKHDLSLEAAQPVLSPWVPPSAWPCPGAWEAPVWQETSPLPSASSSLEAPRWMAPVQSFVLPTWTLLTVAFLLPHWATHSLGGLRPLASFFPTLFPSSVN